jgi:hypothetical protein
MPGVSSSVNSGMTRRNLLAVLMAQPLLAARSRISKNRVSAVTDEIGSTQSQAVEFAKRFNMQWVELRKIPGTDKEFVSLTAPELKRYAAELGENKIKVSMLHTSSPKPEAIDAALTLGAAKLLVPAGVVIVSSPTARALTPAGVDWNPGKDAAQPARGTVLNVRIPSLMEMNWRRVLEALERDNYQGEICLETPPDKADEAIRELMHFVGEL